MKQEADAASAAARRAVSDPESTGALMREQARSIVSDEKQAHAPFIGGISTGGFHSSVHVERVEPSCEVLYGPDRPVVALPEGRLRDWTLRNATSSEVYGGFGIGSAAIDAAVASLLGDAGPKGGSGATTGPA